MFKVVINYEAVGEFSNFPQAYSCFFQHQEREDACSYFYVEFESDQMGKGIERKPIVLFADEIESLACALGLKRGGELVPIFIP